MEELRDGDFSRHFIKNDIMRNQIDRTVALSDHDAAEFANDINGADVLIIDDTISIGQSLKEVWNILQTNYKPKSITALPCFLQKCDF